MGALSLAVGACGGPAVRQEPPPEAPAVIEVPLLIEPALEPPSPSAAQADAGHETVPDEGEPAPAIPGPEEGMVQFAYLWLGLSREAQRQEFLESEALYLQDGTPYNLVRYALLTALRGSERPGAAKRVRGDLRNYIETYNGSDTPGEFVPLARLLLHLLDEREQLLGQLTAQNETLQRQLDELKAIEEQLRDRAGPEPIQATPQ